mgnify:FL=1
MAFKYINPGYANLLDTDTGTSVEGAAYSKTGTAFWQPAEKRGIVLAEAVTELYGKFDVYLHRESDSGKDNFEVRVALAGWHGARISKRYDDWYVSGTLHASSVISVAGSTDYQNFKERSHLKLEDVNTLYFHVKYKPGTREGSITLMVNGAEIGTGSCEGDAVFQESKVLEIVSTARHGLISNIILSDREIDPREQVVMLPSMSAETTMADSGDGIYTATAAGQILLQTADTMALAAAYGEESQVTGIALVGNPAYRTAEGLCALTALEKNGETVTEFGRHILKGQPTGGIVDSRAVAMRLTELAGRKFGWKAGE